MDEAEASSRPRPRPRRRQNNANRNDEPWEFKITLTKDESAAQFLTIPETVVREEGLFMANISDRDERKLDNGEPVRVSLRSIDRSEFYSMNLKKAVWNPNALMLVPWNDPFAEDDTGTKFFHDFGLGKRLKFGFYWNSGILLFKVLN